MGGEAGACAGESCCAEACDVCEQCSGPGGTCVPVPLREEDNEPEGACTDENWCDGYGHCERKAQVAAGLTGTCALHADGKVTCWGLRSIARAIPGEVPGGFATFTDKVGDDETPASVGPVPLPDKVVELAGGRMYMCALSQTGKVRCWGENYDAALGLGEVQGMGFTDAPDLDVGGDARHISAGRTVSCALRTEGNVRCWGGGQSEWTSADWEDVELGGSAAKVSVGQNRVYATLTTQDARWWSPNDIIGGTEIRLPANEIVVARGRAIEVVAGQYFACALLVGGSVHCWGTQFLGALGSGIDEFQEDFATLPGVPLGAPAKHITSGLEHTCALLEGGRVRCWGNGANGRLGYGNTEIIGDDETPDSAGDVDVGGEVLELAAGHEHTCALLANDAIRCWGNNASGQLGYGHTQDIGDDETPASAGDVPYR